jgi:hypothetical protein
MPMAAASESSPANAMTRAFGMPCDYSHNGHAPQVNKSEASFSP